MSDTPAKTESTENKPAAAPVPAPSGTPKAALIIGAILSGVFAAGGAFAGAKMSGGGHGGGHAEAAPAHAEAKPPGPTMPLDPFLVTISDESHKMHAMKVTLAIEFGETTKEEVLKSFGPRVRDAVLTHLRALSYEDVSEAPKIEKLRNELLEKCQKAGASTAERVLVTDLVIQ